MQIFKFSGCVCANPLRYLQSGSDPELFVLRVPVKFELLKLSKTISRIQFLSVICNQNTAIKLAFLKIATTLLKTFQRG